jgi:hypothetical protein
MAHGFQAGGHAGAGFSVGADDKDGFGLHFWSPLIENRIKEIASRPARVLASHASVLASRATPDGWSFC